MKNSFKLLASVGVLAAGLAAAPVHAQEPPPPPPPSEQPTVVRSSHSGGGAGIGVGGVVWLSGVAGGQFVYDTSLYHVEGLLGFRNENGDGADDSSTRLIIGAAGWYHLHQGASSDFSLGGGIAMNHFSPEMGDSTQTFSIEPGAQARVFLTSNVALHARVGLAFEMGDGPTVIQIAGQTTGALGFTYFFR